MNAHTMTHACVCSHTDIHSDTGTHCWACELLMILQKLRRCQSTRTAKMFLSTASKYSRCLTPSQCVSARHKLPCEERRLLLCVTQQQQITAQVRKKRELIVTSDWLRMEVSWSHLQCDWLVLKSVEKLPPSFSLTPAVQREVILFGHVCLHGVCLIFYIWYMFNLQS